MICKRILLLVILPWTLSFVGAQNVTASAEAVATQYALATSTTLPWPTTTQSNSDTQSFLVGNWNLSKGRIQNGPTEVDFVSDPFPQSPIPGIAALPNTNNVALRVTYPRGSLLANGGTQMFAMWSPTGRFQSMLLQYEVAFDAGFDWVKGGKLPGLRGGPQVDGCTGGNESDGSNCFTSRIMWRRNGAGEVYAYVKSPNLCQESDVLCNDEYGISIQRGAFSFVSGQWNRVTMLVQLNQPGSSNGNLQVYYNDVLKISKNAVNFRDSSAVTVDGLYLSTFFGGNDNSWTPPNTTHTYFRNFRLWSSTSSSTSPSSTGGAARSEASIALILILFAFFIFI